MRREGIERGYDVRIQLNVFETMPEVDRIQMNGEIAVRASQTIERPLEREASEFLVVPGPPLLSFLDPVPDRDHFFHREVRGALGRNQSAQFRQGFIQRMAHDLLKVPQGHVAVEGYGRDMQGSGLQKQTMAEGGRDRSTGRLRRDASR